MPWAPVFHLFFTGNGLARPAKKGVPVNIDLTRQAARPARVYKSLLLGRTSRLEQLSLLAVPASKSVM